MNIISINNVTMYYGYGFNRVKALDHISLDIKEGTMVAITGTSGSGKSTLLHVMGGLEAPWAGDVIVENKNLYKLSNESLKRQIEKYPDSISLKKALLWSNDVNESITKLPEEKILPYEKVKDALIYAHQKADIAIVSSANLKAVLDEWTRHKLIEHTDIVLAQDSGTKDYCISKLLEKGYDTNNVLMCGDALGDLKAAQKNNVMFYPIRVNHEKESWEEFIDIALNKLIDHTYKDKYQEEKIQEFIDNLGGNK